MSLASMPSPASRARWVTLLSAATLTIVSWSLSSPVGFDPDSNFHASSAWCAQTAPTGSCELAEDNSRALIPVRVVASDCPRVLPNGSVVCLERQMVVDTSTARPIQVSPQRGSSGFYEFLGLGVTTSVETSIARMRTIQGLLSVLLIGCASLMLRKRQRQVFLTVSIITQIPLGLSLMASINPSGVEIAMVVAAVPPSIILSDPRRSTQLLVSIAFLGGLLAGSLMIRGSTPFYIMIVVLAVCLPSWLRNAGKLTRSQQAAGVVTAVFAAFGLVFFALRDVLDRALSGYFASGRGDLPRLGQIVETAGGTFLLWFASIGGWVPRDVAGLGGFSIILPKVVSLSVLLAIVFLLRRCRFSREQRNPAVILFGSAWVIPFWTLISSDLEVGQELQPRYVLPILSAGLAYVLVTGETEERQVSKIPWMPLALGVIAHSVSLHAVVSSHSNSGSSFLDLALQSPRWGLVSLHPFLIWILGSLAFARLAFRLHAS